MNKQQLDTFQEMLNRNGYLGRGPSQILIDDARKHVPVEATEKPADEPKPKTRRKTQAE